MIEAFRQWFEARRSGLSQAGFSVDISSGTQGLSNNSIHADMRTKKHELTVQLWETGESDFHYLDWENPDKGVEVTHHVFITEADLFSALDIAIKKMH